MGSVRIFVSFDPPPEVRAGMLDFQRRLRARCTGVTWVRPELFHSTISFLGNIEEAILPALAREIALLALGTPSFEVSYEGLGTFPDARRPKVVWIGCASKDDTLARLKRDLDGIIVRHGIALEDQAFHPHVTLGRVRTPARVGTLARAGDLIPMLESLTFEPRRTRIKGIEVMKSILTPQGASYFVVATNPLQ